MSRSRKAPSTPLSSSSSSSLSPPNEYLCPLSNLVMADPVTTSTNHTFEHAILEACKELNYVPPNVPLSSEKEFLKFLYSPDDDLKIDILEWCDLNRKRHPIPIIRESALDCVRRFISIENDQVNKDDNPFDKDILTEIETSAQDSAIRTLLETILESKDHATLHCTSRIVRELIPLFTSRHQHIQVGSTAAILDFSKVESNTNELVQWGIIPPLLDVVETGLSNARSNASKSITYLAMNQENRVKIGANGTIPRLLEVFFDKSSSQEVRRYAGRALYYLCNCSENLAVLENMRVVEKLIDASTDRSSEDAISLQETALEMLYRLADGSTGFGDIVGCGVVEEMLRMVREGEGRDTHCLSLLDKICRQGRSVFMQLSTTNDAEEVLVSVKEEWGKDEREMAKRMVDVIKQISASKPFDDEDEEEEDQE